MVQGGVSSPNIFVLVSLLFVRGNKTLGLDLVQIVVADDALLGVRRNDLKKLVESVLQLYGD